MKKAIFASILAVVAVSAFAADKTPKSIKCPVTGGTVNIASATKSHMYADYKGRRYFFCCNGCPQAFAKDKAKYAKGPSIATPKTPKKA
jgi:YHS domain-containing protein